MEKCDDVEISTSALLISLRAELRSAYRLDVGVYLTYKRQSVLVRLGQQTSLDVSQN